MKSTSRAQKLSNVSLVSYTALQPRLLSQSKDPLSLSLVIPTSDSLPA